MKVRQEEMPLQAEQSDGKMFIDRLKINSLDELKILEKQAESFVFDKRILKPYKIKLIRGNSIKLARMNLSICPNGTLSIDAPIFDKDYKRAVIGFGPAFVCSPNFVGTYRFENGKWVPEE